MKFLLTNDDGIDAPGLATLEQVVRQIGEVVVVAPDRHLSGCSHQTTTSRPLRLTEVSPSRFMVDGTPADCVRLGLHYIAEDIDWVLAGVNDGGNLGVDVVMSGTVAAAREAAWQGHRAMALSQYRRGGSTDEWEKTAETIRPVLDKLLYESLSARHFWNINLPDSGNQSQDAKIVRCGLEPAPLPIRYEQVEGTLVYRGVYQHRARQAGADVDVCFSGHIAVSELPAGP